MDKKKLHEIIKKSVTVNGIPIGELLPESEEDSDKELKLSFNINVTVRDKK
jgi:hypothetical protein